MRPTLWPILKTAFLLPLALIVLTDYVALLSWWIKVLLCAYILLQAAALVAGSVLGMYKLTEKENPWENILNYRIIKFFPTIQLGAEVFAWDMSEESSESESDSPEPETQTPEELPC
jgi:hypothetical protein